MNLVSYVRVSSREQEQGFSIDAQVKRIQECAEGRGHRIDRVFREVETAKKAGRPIFNEMIELVKRDTSIDGIICHKVDRLCRNFKDYVTVDELQQVGKRLLFVEEDFAPTAAGKLTFGMKVLLAKHYIDNLSDEVKKGMLEKVAQGGYPCHAPWGYRNVKAPHSLEVDPERGPLVRRLFEWYASGRESLESVREKFIATGIAFRQSAPRPSRTAIDYILKNRAYTGWFDFLGNRFKGAYEPIISEDLFERVQATFSGRGHGSGRRGVHINYRGLIVCGACGCLITGEIKKGRYVYYHCTRRRGPCKEPAVREEEIERQITGALQPLALDDAILALARDACLERRAGVREHQEQERRRIEQRIVKLRSFIVQGHEDKLEGRIAGTFWAQRDQEWRAEMATAERGLSDITKGNGDPEIIVRVLELAKKLPAAWVASDRAKRRRILEIVGSNSTLAGGSLFLNWRKPFDLLVKRPSSKDWWAIQESNL